MLIGVPRAETSSPTISTTSIFLISQIAAAEKREVASVDIGSAYLNALMPKTNPSRLVFMRISPEVTNILLDIQPSFRECMNPDRTLVVELDRALYGCIESALLWFKELTTFLTTLHLVPNPHDSCVMNRDDAGGQLTVGIYVDDIIITCKRKETIDELIRALELKYKQLSSCQSL